MVSGERPKTLHRAEKIPTHPWRWGLGHEAGAAQGAEQVCMARPALLCRYTTASGTAETRTAPPSTRGKKASSPNSCLKQDNTPPARPNHSPGSTCKQAGPGTDKGRALGAPRGTGTPRLQGWSTRMCHCRHLAQRAQSPALCCTAHHLSSN